MNSGLNTVIEDFLRFQIYQVFLPFCIKTVVLYSLWTSCIIGFVAWCTFGRLALAIIWVLCLVVHLALKSFLV